MRTIVAGLFALLLAVPCRADVRSEEIAECRSGEMTVWNDGVDRPSRQRAWRVVYRHDGAPARFDRRQVERLIGRAAGAWSQCGIALTPVAADAAPFGTPDVLQVVWSEPGSRGNFGLADLGRGTLSLGPQAFALLQERNPAHDAGQTLQMVISHELGHFLGLMAHSRRCADVLSYYDDGRGNRCQTRSGIAPGPGVEYRALLPTACDIARCRSVNKLPPLPDNRLAAPPTD